MTLKTQIDEWFSRKNGFLYLLIGLGLLAGMLGVIADFFPKAELGVQVFISLTFNIATMGWCYADAREHHLPVSRIMSLCFLLLAGLAIPWYFIKSRGLVGALKAGFGLWLFAIWFLPFAGSAFCCFALAFLLGAQPRH